MEIQQLLPYPYYIACVFNRAQYDELRAQFNLPSFGYWEDPEEDWPVASASFLVLKEQPRKLGIMCFYDKDFDICTVAHEGVHVMSDLMHRLGITYDPLNDEPYAYQLEQIMYFARHKYNELHGAAEQVEKAVIETGNHPKLLDMAPQQPVFSLDNLNADNTNFLDDK